AGWVEQSETHHEQTQWASLRSTHPRTTADKSLGRDDERALPHGVKAPGQNALLRVQAIFGLIEHHRLRPVDHLVGDLLAAMGGQAMHEDRVGLGLSREPRIDLIALEPVVTG